LPKYYQNVRVRASGIDHCVWLTDLRNIEDALNTKPELELDTKPLEVDF